MLNLSIQAEAHLFWAASSEDAWYRANGTTKVRSINGNADQHIGAEFDLNVLWKASSQVMRNILEELGTQHPFHSATVLHRLGFVLWDRRRFLLKFRPLIGPRLSWSLKLS